MRGIGREGDGGNTDEVTARRCRGVKLLVSVVIDRYHRLQLDQRALDLPQAAPNEKKVTTQKSKPGSCASRTEPPTLRSRSRGRGTHTRSSVPKRFETCPSLSPPQLEWGSQNARFAVNRGKAGTPFEPDRSLQPVGSPDPGYRCDGLCRGFPAHYRPPLFDIQHQWGAKECVG